MVASRKVSKPLMKTSTVAAYPHNRHRTLSQDLDDDNFSTKPSAYPMIEETNTIHYQITHDGPNFKKLSLHPLESHFIEFARLRPHKKSLTEEPPEEVSSKIAQFGIEAWFTQAKIFSTPLCKITLYDVRSMFWRGQKPSLSFKEFETFIEDLAEFRKIHPDTIVFLLRLCGSPELESRLSHLTVPEGTVDRVVDAFRMESENIKEEFVNLSKTRYEEPVCFGGVPHARKNKNLKLEQEALKSQATSLMKKADTNENLDPLAKNFIYFAKNGNYYSDGRTIELTQLIKWMKQARIIDGATITSLDVGFLFKRLYGLNWRIYYDDLLPFLRDLANWKEISRKGLLKKLQNCDPPASSSITIISLTLPEGELDSLKAALTDYAEDYEENRDLYEPTAADGPFGHTPNSRNRHFQNCIEERINKVYSGPRGDKKKKIDGNQRTDSVMITTKTSENSGNNNKEEAFSEERRGGKDHLAKRWNDAYPIGGMEAIHRARIEADLKKLMFGTDRADDSSSSDEEKIKKKIFRYELPLRTGVPHTPIPLEEQFEKFKKYGEYSCDDGITLKNIELWFTLAGMLSHANTLFTSHDLESKFKQFKFAQEHHWIDYDRFLVLLEALAGMAKKKTNIKEMKERIQRCDPPMKASLKPSEEKEQKRGSKDSSGSRNNSLNNSNSPRPSKAGPGMEEDVSKIQFEDKLKFRFHEFARFGEPTVPDAYSIPGLSMLNADKWFRQAKLMEHINPGDVDVLYKQLYPNKQRINFQEFSKLTRALLDTTPKKDGITYETFVHNLTECGPPHITDPSPSSKRPS